MDKIQDETKQNWVICDSGVIYLPNVFTSKLNESNTDKEEFIAFHSL